MKNNNPIYGIIENKIQLNHCRQLQLTDIKRNFIDSLQKGDAL
jgi:hypothetical protein